MRDIRAALRTNPYLTAAASRLNLAPVTVASITGITLTALLVRLAWLSTRPMHFDEARVAYWILQSAETGQWEYRYIIHGPLIQHINRHLFPVFGAGDFVARFPLAVVGGLLPLTAILFRSRLTDRETIALAGFLAFNPMLWYYSRFMRSDLLVGAFAFATLGFLLRLYETRRMEYLYVAVIAFTLSFAAKENAIVYVLCWGGMLGLVFGLEVLDPRRFDSRTAMWDYAVDTVNAKRQNWTAKTVGILGLHGIVAVFLFLCLTFFLFAPRAPAGEGIGLYHSSLPKVYDATIASIEQGYDHWVGGSEELAGCGGNETDRGRYLCHLGRELDVLARTSIGVAAFSFIGLLAEFRRESPRVLVPAAFYWGVASLLGYPLGTDIIFPSWITMHAIIPLTIPAAVGLMEFIGWTRDSIDADSPLEAVPMGLALLLVLGSVAGVGIHFNYVDQTDYNSETTAMVQFAQPEEDMNHGVNAIERASRSNDGLDIVVYSNRPGERFQFVREHGGTGRAVPCMRFINSLPLSWYFYSYDADTACSRNTTALASQVEANPPVIIARDTSTPDVEDVIEGMGYVAVTYETRRNTREATFYYDPDQVNPPAGATPVDASTQESSKPNVVR